jgi:adenosylhomocysteinase
MEGYEVRTMAEAAKQGDLFITVTGCRDVITKEHYPFMKNGAILCNAGHFNVEININQLEDLSESHSEVRSHITSYRMQDGREIQLLAQGRLVNLAAGDGHPAEIMDMSFSLQALSVKYLAEHGRKMQRGVYDLPANIDNQVALYLLDHLEHQIDRLTPDQSHYLSSWDI